MLFRALLALALFAPQATAVAHALETARREANHPVCLNPTGSHAEPASDHAHHDEHGCAQCPRPFQAGVQAAPALETPGPSSFIEPHGAALRPAASPLPRPARGPPSA